MNRKYNLKLDLQFRCNNSTMKFNQFDNNTSDFFMRITNGGNLVDIEKAIVVLAIIKPSGKVASQFVEVENGLVYADLKPNMRDEIGTYTAKAMLILEDERVVTDSISYKVEEDKIFSLLNDTLETAEDFALLTDMLNRLSTIEISEEQRVINEAERILSEENRKIEEAKRVEAELIRQHEEADRAKYDATRESNENIRKQNESIRLANETNRVNEEAKRVEEEANRVEAEQLRKDNYNFMTEDEERRRVEANSHKKAEKLRAQAENTRVNEEAKRRTTEQARVSAENTRVSNENTRKDNEATRQTNETKRVEAETQRQNRYNSFIADAEINANNFENYTNSAKIKEEERKSNELDRKSQEDRRVSNEVERISNENTRKANEAVREKNETSRQNTFANKVNEVDKKIIELNTTKDNFVSNINTKVDTKISEIDNVKDNFVSSVNTKVDNKISELDNAKSDMTNTVSNKVNEVETRFNALTSSQQQDAEVIDARVDFKGVAFDSLKERIDYTDKLLRDSTVSTIETESDFTTVEATGNGYFEDVKLEGKTLVNLAKQPTNNGSINHQYATISTVTNIKPSTEYTYIIRNNGSETLKLYLNTNGGFDWFDLDVEANSTVIGKAKTLPTIDGDIWLSLKKAETVEQNLQVALLEGDHTQNPPSYFEGLKSVGQSATTSEDGADEIVVSSVKGDGNLWSIDNVYYGDVNTATGKLNPEAPGVVTSKQLIPVNSTNIYAIGYDKDETLRLTSFFCYDKFKQYLGIAYNNKLLTNTFFIRPRFVKTDFSPIDKASVSVSLSKTEEGLSTPYQSDKKRLLYYNEETQTWEKPILREWDSIEKHSDGKYYYHQRSGEANYIGDLAEQWTLTSTENELGNIQFSIPNKEIRINSWTLKALCNNFVIRGHMDGNIPQSLGLNGYGRATTISIHKSKLSTQDLTGFKQWLQTNNVTVVYQLAQEKVYECTNIDLITYTNETNYIVESGAIVPKTTLKVHNNISNVVSLLQKKVSLLESNVTSYMITQNRLMLASRYNADTVSFKVDVASFSDTFEYDNDLYELILNNILVGKDNYNREYIENLIRFYWMDFIISDEMYSTLFEIIEEQHNPKIEETPLI